MNYSIEQDNGRATSVTCNDCNRLIPFVQPQLSTDVADVTVISHSCPPAILAATQQAVNDAFAQASFEAALAEANVTESPA